MELFGYFSAVVTGLTLGLIGGGGSILTVPILTYLFKVPAALATHYSLLIVGVCAAVGVVPFARRRLVEFKTSLIFFFPAVIGVLFSRRVLLPALPNKDVVVLGTFAIVMIAAAWSMIRKKPVSRTRTPHAKPLGSLFNGAVVGTITGFVGAGGGFLIIPALVNGLGLSMEKAIGTSLLIIAMNSLSGFFGDAAVGMPVQWNLIFRFIGAALIGIVGGTYLNQFIPGAKLKVGFGWFVLVLGTFIILNMLNTLRS